MRVYDWEKRLQKVIDDWEKKPFIWGESDCVHFAVACFHAVTSTKIDLDKFTGKYSDRKSAEKLMRDNNMNNIKFALEEVTGIKTHENILYARRGDIVLHSDGALGVCLGSHCAFHGARASLKDCVLFLPITGD